MTDRYRITAGATVLACLALAACAGNSVQKLDPTTRAFVLAAGTWDVDRDGTVSCKDWKDYATRQFKSADTRADGTLDADEYKSLGARDTLFQSVDMAFFDGNGDKRLTLQEFVEKPNPAFPYIDTDNDCNMTFVELTAGQKQRKKTISRDDLLKDDSPR